jgi:predicted GNAT superfamily acetyltransferase
MSEVHFRDLSSMAEFREAEDVQRAVWGHDDLEDPGDLMMVIQSEGGLVGGAFQDGHMLGYVFGFPTSNPDIQHSHRLAVLPKARGLRLGARLKWYQRDWCLARGITHVRWTFDPLRIANANLNIGHLGAEATTYHVDYYGEMDGINRGVPSDRLLADWWLDQPRVAARAAGTPPAEGDGVDADHRIAIPADFGELMRTDPASALALRLSLRARFTDLLDRGCVIRGFDAAARQYFFHAP